MDATNSQCLNDQIAAYLDGELGAESASAFEQHVCGCSFCLAELRRQQRFILELDSAITLPPDLALPRDFTRIVAARAQSDLSGMRDRFEHRRALRLCLILAFGGFTLLGAAAVKSMLLSSRMIAEAILGIFSLILTTLQDALVGLIVIARVIVGGLFPESHFAGLAALLLALAVVVLSLLIRRYHQESEMRIFE